MKVDDRERSDDGRTRIARIKRMGESQAILGMGGRRAQNSKKIDLENYKDLKVRKYMESPSVRN